MPNNLLERLLQFFRPLQPTFEQWKVSNPEGTFKRYYADTAVYAPAGKERASLGPNLRPGSLKRASGTAQKLIHHFRIRNSDLVVDYGCGTLRIGKLMIEYLEPDCYVGLDIDQRIIEAGRAMLPANLLEQKRPILDVINNQSLDRISEMHPNWIYSKGVLQHVPPDDLIEYFHDISRLIQPNTTALVWARLSKCGQQLSKKTWVHRFDDIHALAEANDLHANTKQNQREDPDGVIIRLKRTPKAL